MNTIRYLFTLALGLLLCACSKTAIEDTDVPGITETTNNVHLQISTDNWNGINTRATGEPLTPVTLLLVPDGGAAVITKKVVEDDDYTLEIPNGSYEIFAVCGLLEDEIPDDLFDEIEIPLAESGNGLTDFAVGSATISNEYGKLSASSVSITAKRQMAWLTATINDIPSSFTEIALYAKGVGETYNLAEKWSISEEGKNKLTDLTLARKAGKNFAKVDKVCIPCVDSAGDTEFRIVAKTNEGKTLTYTYISSTPLTAGKHLTLNLAISNLSIVSETITTEGWDEKTENGTLTNPTVE